MKTKILFVILLVIIVKFSVAGVFVKKQFFSEALNRDETYFISYPTGYSQADTSKKFPVVIFLHSASVDAQETVDQFETVLSNPLSSLIIQNIYKVIFIIPNGEIGPFLGSFYTNSDLYGNYEDYIYSDLIKEVRSNYNTYDQREKWSIMGHSMGGYGSMKIALKHPELFVAVASLSGPLHTTYYDDILPLLLEEHGSTPPYDFTYQGDVTKLIYSMAGAFSPDTTSETHVIFPVLTDGTINPSILPLWSTNNPINLIGKWKGSPDLAIFMYCGELDEYKLLSQNQLFSDTLTSYGITHTFYIDPDGDHITSLMTSFPMGLNFLKGVMDTATSTNTSVKQEFIQQEFIYPNPVKSNIFLSTNANKEIQEAAILSLSGSLLQRFTIKGNEHSFPVQNLMHGCYLFSITYTDGQVSKFRFVKTD